MTRKTLSLTDLITEYEYVGEFYENKAIIKKDGRYGFVEKVSKDQYEEFVKPKYVKAYEYIGGYAQVVNEEMKYIFLNNKGEECLNKKDNSKYFYEEARI